MKILFLSNPLALDGAPLELKQIVSYLKTKHKNWILDIYTDRNDLEYNLFEKIADKVYEKAALYANINLLDRIKMKVFKTDLAVNILNKFFNNNQYDILYANSVVMLERAIEFKKYNPKARIFLHLRELEYNCTQYVSDFFTDVHKADVIVVISKAVWGFVTNKCGIEEHKVVMAYSGINSDLFKNKAQQNYGDDTTINSDGIIIGSVGALNFRKGIEIFMALALKLHKYDPTIRFQWIGAINTMQRLQYDIELRKMGLSQNFEFLGQRKDVFSIMANWKIFVSAAREEPLGVAILEAGFLGKPVVAFKKSGGPDEILENGGGGLAEYLDIDDMYYKVTTLLRDQKYYQLQSEIIRKEAQKYDFGNSLIIIDNLLKRWKAKFSQ